MSQCSMRSKKTPCSRFELVVFLLLSVIVFGNLNGMIKMMTNVAQVASILIGAFCLVLFYYYGRGLRANLSFRLPAGWFVLFYLYYIFIGTAVTAISPYGTTSLALMQIYTLLASLLVICAYAAITFTACQGGWFSVLLKILLIVSCFSILTGLLDVYVPGWSNMVHFRKEIGGRARGFFANPNELGIQCGFTLAFSIGLAMLRRNIYWFLFPALLCAMVAFFSASKTAILMLLMELFAGAYFLRRSSSNIKNLMSITIALGLVFIMLWTIRTIAQGESMGLKTSHELERRMSHLNELLFEHRVDDKTTTGRGSQWAEALEMWLASPIIGHGAGTMVRMPKSGLGPHNTILLALSETGFLGFFLMALAWMVFFSQTYRTRNYQVFALVMLLSVGMMAGLLSTHNWLDDRNQNAVLGICIGMIGAFSQHHRAKSGKRVVYHPIAAVQLNHGEQG